jgi:hypothetical protein
MPAAAFSPADIDTPLYIIFAAELILRFHYFDISMPPCFHYYAAALLLRHCRHIDYAITFRCLLLMPLMLVFMPHHYFFHFRR